MYGDIHNNIFSRDKDSTTTVTVGQPIITTKSVIAKTTTPTKWKHNYPAGKGEGKDYKGGAGKAVDYSDTATTHRPSGKKIPPSTKPF
eukprot:3951868-Amphidinium_carterae.1